MSMIFQQSALENIEESEDTTQLRGCPQLSTFPESVQKDSTT